MVHGAHAMRTFSCRIILCSPDATGLGTQKVALTCSRLCIATLDNDVETLSSLLQAGPASAQDLDAALLLAAAACHENVSIMLLAHNANPNGFGDVQLLNAVAHGHLTLDCSCLQHRSGCMVCAHAYSISRKRQAAVSFQGASAVRRADARLAHLLILHGANASAQDASGMHALAHAALSSNAYMIKALIAAGALASEPIGNCGATSITLAACLNDVECITALTAGCAAIAQIRDAAGNNALHYALRLLRRDATAALLGLKCSYALPLQNMAASSIPTCTPEVVARQLFCAYGTVHWAGTHEQHLWNQVLCSIPRQIQRRVIVAALAQASQSPISAQCAVLMQRHCTRLSMQDESAQHEQHEIAHMQRSQDLEKKRST